MGKPTESLPTKGQSWAGFKNSIIRLVFGLEIAISHWFCTKPRKAPIQNAGRPVNSKMPAGEGAFSVDALCVHSR